MSNADSSAPAAVAISGLRKSYGNNEVLKGIDLQVRAGETLLEIVPQDTRLEVEGRLPVNLVDKVGSHLPVDILFTAFNQSRTPRVPGQVSLISADQMLDEKTGAPYYVLRTTVSDMALEKLHGLVIKPGMPAEMFVRTGERSLLNYLFKPLLDRAGSALTEE